MNGNFPISVVCLAWPWLLLENNSLLSELQLLHLHSLMDTKLLVCASFPFYSGVERPLLVASLNFLPRDTSEPKCCEVLLVNFISQFIHSLIVFSPQSLNLKFYYIFECFGKLAAGQTKKCSQ